MSASDIFFVLLGRFDYYISKSILNSGKRRLSQEISSSPQEWERRNFFLQSWYQNNIKQIADGM